MKEQLKKELQALIDESHNLSRQMIDYENQIKELEQKIKQCKSRASELRGYGRYDCGEIKRKEQEVKDCELPRFNLWNAEYCFVKATPKRIYYKEFGEVKEPSWIARTPELEK